MVLLVLVVDGTGWARMLSVYASPVSGFLVKFFTSFSYTVLMIGLPFLDGNVSLFQYSLTISIR